MRHALFAAQRAMRDQLRSALKRGLLGLIDIGTSKTACVILRVDPAKLAVSSHEEAHLGGFGAMRVIGVGVTRSRGVRLGEIVEMEECERAIRTALQQAEKMAGVRVDQVVGAISGARPASFGATGETEVMTGEVTEADVAAALAMPLDPAVQVERTCGAVHVVERPPRGRAGLVDRGDDETEHDPDRRVVRRILEVGRRREGHVDVGRHVDVTALVGDDGLRPVRELLARPDDAGDPESGEGRHHEQTERRDPASARPCGCGDGVARRRERSAVGTDGRVRRWQPIETVGALGAAHDDSESLIRARTSSGIRAQSADVESALVTARSTTGRA